MEKQTRLSPLDWIRAAVERMAAHGVAAVKVEALARDLHVSKGSFYWHFKNRAALLEAVLQTWEQETDDIVAHASQQSEPLARLTGMFAYIGELAAQSGGYSIDTAIMRWAQQDEAVAARVKVVEQTRGDFVRDALVEFGLSAETATNRAQLMYFAFMGYSDRANRDHTYREPQQLAHFGRIVIDLVTRPEGALS